MQIEHVSKYIDCEIYIDRNENIYRDVEIYANRKYINKYKYYKYLL